MEGLRKRLETFEDTSRKKIAKLGKLELSGNQAKEKTFDELYDMAVANIDKIVEENKTATDEKVTKELNDLKIKHSEALKTLEEREKEFTDNLTKKEQEWQQQSYSKDAQSKILNEVSKLTYITDKPEALQDLHKTLTEKIMNNCKIVNFDTLEVKQPDGVNIISFSPSEIAKTLPDVVAHYAKPWVAVSQKGEEGDKKKVVIDTTKTNQQVVPGLEAMTQRYEQMTQGKAV